MPSGVLSTKMRIVPVLLEEELGVSLATRVSTVFGPREEKRGVGDSTRTTSSSKRSSVAKIVMRS